MALRSVTYESFSDAELMREISSRSAVAFDELYRRYGQKLFSFFYRMLWKDKELAEDQTQELFLKVIKNAESFDESRSFSIWLYSIANNMCKNEYRKAETKQKHKPVVSDTHHPQGEKNMDLKGFGIAVERLIRGLPDEKKSLYLLRFQDQLTVPEISSIMSIPEGTVKSRIFNLLKELKGSLKQFETIHLYP
jgi:RNA polymerase sigma-70 factor (ECF subfamily)